jgi:hypothetical protein
MTGTTKVLPLVDSGALLPVTHITPTLSLPNYPLAHSPSHHHDDIPILRSLFPSPLDKMVEDMWINACPLYPVPRARFCAMLHWSC